MDLQDDAPAHHRGRQRGFSKRGVTASSNDDILAVAGASHSQLYHYFTDRDDLVAAVIADRVEQVPTQQESLLADLEQHRGPPTLA